MGVDVPVLKPTGIATFDVCMDVSLEICPAFCPCFRSLWGRFSTPVRGLAGGVGDAVGAVVAVGGRKGAAVAAPSLRAPVVGNSAVRVLCRDP